jgi:hypothetical protein
MVALVVKRCRVVAVGVSCCGKWQATKHTRDSGFWSLECSFLEWSLLSLFDTAFFSFGESYENDSVESLDEKLNFNMNFKEFAPTASPLEKP